jgi:hypothetical protein
MLCSPGFLDINGRFEHFYNQVDTTLFKNSTHTEKSSFKKYMRVKYKDIVGEVVEVDETNITIAYSDKRLAGWSSEGSYNYITVDSSLCEKLDNGLNSAFEVDLKALKLILENE